MARTTASMVSLPAENPHVVTLTVRLTLEGSRMNTPVMSASAEHSLPLSTAVPQLLLHTKSLTRAPVLKSVLGLGTVSKLPLAVLGITVASAAACKLRHATARTQQEVQSVVICICQMFCHNIVCICQLVPTPSKSTEPSYLVHKSSH